MASIPHDSQGFLLGDLLELNKELAEGQELNLRQLRNISANVGSIARAMGVQVRGSSAAGGRQARQTVSPAGRAAAAVPGVARGSTPRGAASLAGARAATIVTRTRDRGGRFIGNGRQSNEGGAGGGGGGGEGAGGGRIAGALGRVGGALEHTQGIDPTIAAANELRETLTPLGRGLTSMFGKSAERKKERWYKRFYEALTVRGKGGGAGGAGSIGNDNAGFAGVLAGVTSKIAPFLMAAIPAIMGSLGVLLAGGAGALVGTGIYTWLDKSGIAGKIFDLFDKAAETVKSATESVQKFASDIDKGDSQVDRTRFSQEQLRRFELTGDPNPPLPPSDGFGTSTGRVRAGVRNFLVENMGFSRLDDTNNPLKRKSGKALALSTGAQYAAGNIGGLSDAQTRALVASTALTESGGGKLDVVNKAGYMGRYQAGAGWLADAGLLKGGSSAVRAAMKADGFTNEYKWGESGGMTRFLKNGDNWTQGMDYQKYLGSATTQDLAFKTNSDAAYKSLMANPNVKDKSPESMAGLLKARHLAGMGGALAVAGGGTGAADANGTTAMKYFQDVAQDRGGFRAAYSAGAMKPMSVNMPSSVPDRIPALPEVFMPSVPRSSDQPPITAMVREPIGQNVGDRGIAHVVTGGMGGS